jgi:hypothetical protein
MSLLTTAAVALAALTGGAAVTVAPPPPTPPTPTPPITLPSIFGSSMVIQRGQPFPLWGSNSPSSGAVSVAYRGMTYPAAAVGSGGVAWRVVLPAHEATSEPANITITAAGWHGGAIVFTDCLVGDVYVCVGQSNMALPVAATFNMQSELREAGSYGATLRVMQLRPVRGATAPQRDPRLGIGWSRAGAATVKELSALCYYFAQRCVTTYPSVPVGVVASAYSGTAIAPWLPPGAHARCTAGLPPPLNLTSARMIQTQNDNPDPGLEYLGHNNSGGVGGAVQQWHQQSGTPPPPTPCVPKGCGSVCGTSCLWNAMVTPLTALPLAGWLYYQGESDTGTQCGYADCGRYYSACFPELIRSYRAAWRAVHPTMHPHTPFLFVQLSAWPDGDRGYIAALRQAQLAALQLNHTGMAVVRGVVAPPTCFILTGISLCDVCSCQEILSDATDRARRPTSLTRLGCGTRCIRRGSRKWRSGCSWRRSTTCTATTRPRPCVVRSWWESQWMSGTRRGATFTSATAQWVASAPRAMAFQGVHPHALACG